MRERREKRGDGIYLDLTKANVTFTPRDDGKRLTLAAWDTEKPHVDDYLLLKDPKGGHVARYKVLDVDLCMNVDPANMFTATARHAPSTEP